METEILAALISAIPATILSIVSLISTLLLHKSLRREETEPQVKIEQFKHNANDMIVYAPTGAKGWGETEILDTNVLKFVKDTVNTVCFKEFGDRKYLVINICEKDYDESGLIVLCNPLELTLKNHNNYISEIKILKAYSKINARTELLYKKNYNVTLYPDNAQEIKLNIMYITEQNNGASINIEELKESYINRSPETQPIIIDVANNKNMEGAGALIAFTDSSYLFKCRGLRRDFYGAIRMRLVKASNGDKKILSINPVSDRNAKKSFRQFYREAYKNSNFHRNMR